MKTTIFSRRILLRACVAAVALSGGTSWGFKPEYTAHGHTMITRSILGNGTILGDGYRFGEVDGYERTVAPFRYRLSIDSEDRPAVIEAVEHIVFGVQSRDLGFTGDGSKSCSSGVEYLGAPSPAARREFTFWSNDRADTVPVCISVDIDEVDVRIADRFNVDGLRLVVDFFFKIGKIVRVDEVRLDAKRIKRRVEEVERAAVNR